MPASSYVEVSGGFAKVSGGDYNGYFQYTSKGADGKSNDEAVSSQSSKVIAKDGQLTLNTGASSGSSLTGGKKITIASEKNDTGVKFTITGIDAATGQAGSEILNGTDSSTVQSTKKFTSVGKGGCNVCG